MSKKLNTPIHYDSIIEMASKYIIKYIDRKFSTMYWISGGKRGHGKVDYDEMPKIILHLMKEQLFIVVPFIFEDEKNVMMYKMMKDTLNKLPEPINTKYVDIHQIDLDEIRKDVALTLANIFKPTTSSQKGVN